MMDPASSATGSGMSGNIGLNVGGKVYQTSRATLTRYPGFFAGLLGGRIPSAKDKHENYMIDRDGEIFRHVLNFMRCGELVLPDGFTEFSLLEREADFFALEELKSIIHMTETIGIVDENSSVIYKMSRQSLMREKDSYFAKLVMSQTYSLKDSCGNFVVDSRGSKDEFKEILWYLKRGIILSELKYSSPWHENKLYKMADHFGLEVLKDQVKETMLNRALLEVYWQKGPDCSVYFRKGQPGLREICQEYAQIYTHTQPELSFERCAGLVDLRTIFQDDPVTQESLTNVFKEKLDVVDEPTCASEELISAPYCVKLTFYGLLRT